MDERYKILVVDDELANLQKLRRTFIDRYPVLAAGSGREALEYVAKEPDIAVIVADQRMPDMTGVEFLQKTLAPLPHAVRIILTGFTDVDVLMEAINNCKVFRYMIKPWDPPDLLMTVERGLEAYRLTVENEQYRKELIRRERLARELEIAGEIQRYLLPPTYPKMEDYELAAEYHPAREVGGDLYDFELSASRDVLQLVIGDVSGKSIPAALYGAVFSGHVRTLFAQNLQPGEALQVLNARLIQRYHMQNFISVAQMRLDLKSGNARLANSGVPYPCLVHNGKITQLTASGVPLGFFDEAEYVDLQFYMQPGDLAILATDGLIDALDPDGRMFDEDRYLESVLRHAHQPVAQCLRNICEDVLRFAQNAALHDDITLLALRRR